VGCALPAESVPSRTLRGHSSREQGRRAATVAGVKPVLALALLAVLACVALVSVQASAQAQNTRAVDRTVDCAAAEIGGIHEVRVEARAGAVRRGSSWEKPATTIVTTGSTASTAEALDNVLAWAIAGSPTRDATVIPDERAFGNYTYPIHDYGTLAMAQRCRVSRTRLPLSSRGLRRRAVDWLGQILDCPSSRRILVRVRATLTASASLSPRRGGNLGTATPLREARVVVATSSGRRLAYAQVLSSGRASLWTATSCVAD
jgi:hypothetical protein